MSQIESEQPESEFTPEMLGHQEVPVYKRKSFQILSGLAVVGGAFGAGVLANSGEVAPSSTEETAEDDEFVTGTDENSVSSENETTKSKEEQGVDSLAQDDQGSNEKEANEKLEKSIWISTWEAEAESVAGPRGDGRTHQAMSNITASLLARLSSAQHAETNQEFDLNSRIQNIHNATYYVENEGEILEIHEPVVYGIFYEGEGTVNFSWQANVASRDNYVLFYKHESQWQSFVLSEHNDVRWFSDPSAQLVGVAYEENGPIIREGRVSEASLQNESQPILINTGGYGPVQVPENPKTYSSIEGIVDELMETDGVRPNDLLTLNTDIAKG